MTGYIESAPTVLEGVVHLNVMPWEFETGGFSDVLHYAVGDGVVYLAGRDGNVYAHAAPVPGGD